MARKPALENNPELAMKVGFVIGHYTALEYHLFVLYAAFATHMVDEVTPDHIQACFEKFYEQRSINRKTELLIAEAEPLVESVLLGACHRVCKRMKTAARKRTMVAHHGFMRDAKGDWHRLTNTNKKAHFEPITDDFFTRIRDQYRTLGRDLTTLLTFVVQIEDRATALLRALPLPPETPFPLDGKVLPAADAAKVAETEASIARLQLQSLKRPDR
jgi:hypothetical protein